MMKSTIATDRTLAVRVLHQNNLITKDDVQMLCNMLSEEKALYVRIEIEKILVDVGPDNLPILLQYLGTIGKNQHSFRGKTSFKKSNPLPRDLIARVIGHFSNCDIEYLYSVISVLHKSQLSELIDAIGFFTFYNPQYANDHLFKKMMHYVLSNYRHDELIMWKFYTFCSSFAENQTTFDFLSKELSIHEGDSEIERSLSFFKSFRNSELKHQDMI